MNDEITHRFLKAKTTLSDEQYREFCVVTFKTVARELLYEVEYEEQDLRGLLDDLEVA